MLVDDYVKNPIWSRGEGELAERFTTKRRSRSRKGCGVGVSAFPGLQLCSYPTRSLDALRNCCGRDFLSSHPDTPIRRHAPLRGQAKTGVDEVGAFVDARFIDDHRNFYFRGGDHLDVDVRLAEQFEHFGGDTGV